MGSLSDLPIGVFDSGLGGFTVLRALREKLPLENFVYLGDVARLPYGSKSQSVIREYARQCIRFLLKQPVKAVVIACNTATAMALEPLQDLGVPLFGVINPGVRAGIAATGRKGVLVLATESTVKSETYLKEFAALDPELVVDQLACPLLVPLAEEGWFDHSITEQVISQYLARVDLGRFDTVVLGCTHFPLLEPSFRRVLPEAMAIVHGAGLLAEDVVHSLARDGLLNRSGLGKVKLLTTDRVSFHLPLLGDWLDAVSESQVVHLSLTDE